MKIPTGSQVFDRFQPLAHAGDLVTIKPTYQIKDGNHEMLDYGNSPAGVQVAVEGPRLKLEPAEIAGVYPASGSDDSPADYLPHIALTRRTFAWERPGPGGKPWMALLLVKASEITKTTLVSTTVGKVSDSASHDRFHTTMKLPDDAAVFVADLPNSLLAKILPRRDEVELLCHGKRILYDDNDKQDFCIIIGNRLPTAAAKPEPHTALLVSLEQRDDLYNAAGNFAKGPAGVSSLIVLYSWTFTPSNGKDFEQVMKSIRIQPNGGVLRFGSEAWPVDKDHKALAGGFQPLLKSNGYPVDPLPHDQAGNVEYRGPLCPFPPPARSTGVAIRAAPEEFDNNSASKNYAYAAAFELGRLLALSNATILQSMRTIYNLPDRIFDKNAINSLPVALQKKDWVQDHENWEQPWEQATSIVQDETGLLKNGLADYTGIVFEGAAWQQTIVSQVKAIGAAVPLTTVDVNIDTVSVENLSIQFPDVLNAGRF